MWNPLRHTGVKGVSFKNKGADHHMGGVGKGHVVVRKSESGVRETPPKLHVKAPFSRRKEEVGRKDWCRRRSSPLRSTSAE